MFLHGALPVVFAICSSLRVAASAHIAGMSKSGEKKSEFFLQSVFNATQIYLPLQQPLAQITR